MCGSLNFFNLNFPKKIIIKQKNTIHEKREKSFGKRIPFVES